MAVLTLDKIIFRNNDSYLKMYKGSELIAEVEQGGGLDYLTFTALEAGSTVYYDGTRYVTLEKSLDGGQTWSSFNNSTDIVTLTNVGDSVKVRDTKTETRTPSSGFVMTGQIKASGSIMSLQNGDPNDTSAVTTKIFMCLFKNCTALKDITELKLPATTLTQSTCYYQMFQGCTGITSIPSGFLPATTLTEACYGYMFQGCTGLTTIPENLLPVTTLATYCYSNMFSGCTSLTTIPNNLLQNTTLVAGCYSNMFQGCTGLTTVPSNLLPATTLALSCYNEMFRDCTGLTTIPNNFLQNTTLAQSCYNGMFTNCTSLTTIPENLLPATRLANDCYYQMFSGCTKLTTVPSNLLPARTLAIRCYYGLFSGCTGLTTAPTLPATTLAIGCYSNMFNGCTNLNKVVTYAEDISATNCINNWLYNVSSTGDFYNYGGAIYTTGVSGIPEGWTELLQSLTFTALEANSTVKFNRDGVTSEYSTDYGTTWNKGDNVTVTLSNIGDKVMYRGTTSTAPSNTFAAFTLTGQVKASGSVNSMINNNPNDTSLGRSSIFSYYFYNQDALKDISKLILPATTLTSNCYYKMFFSCNEITTGNFLPATNLASSCYDSMFENCSSLTTAPTLPATTLADTCYSNMFNGCTNLNKVVTYAEDISATNCINNWLYNVSSTGDFYNYGGAIYPSGASGIPEGWTEHALPNYLTFTALEAGSTVKFNRTGVTSEYSTDYGTTWNKGDKVTVTLSNIGDKVMYRGTTSKISSSNTTPAFTLTGQIKASGNVNSMINNNPDDTSLNKKNYVFKHYFYNQSALKDISELILPATTLTNYCYQNMFYGCTGLTTIPKNLLPATSLANYCYNHMFYGCTSLTQAPDLPAEASRNYCYASMFEKCSSLVDGGPKIWLRETSASNCLQLMFSECTKLNRAYIRVQSSDSFSNAGYWLDSVGSYGYIIVPALNSNYKYSDFPSGYNGLPDTWGVSDSKWDN